MQKETEINIKFTSLVTAQLNLNSNLFGGDKEVGQTTHTKPDKHIQAKKNKIDFRYATLFKTK